MFIPLGIENEVYELWVAAVKQEDFQNKISFAWFEELIITLSCINHVTEHDIGLLRSFRVLR